MRSRPWWFCAVMLFACAPSRHDHGPGGGGPDAEGPCTAGSRQCIGNAFEVCGPDGWIVVEQCPAFCTEGGCASCADGTCGTTACDQVSQDQSYIGCEYWAVDLDNATEVLGRPEPMLPAGMQCELYQSSKQIMRPMRVCYDGTFATAGACDPPNDACPTGFTCTDSPGPSLPLGICALDGDRSPFAIVVSNPQAIQVAVTIENQAGQSMSVVVPPGTIQSIFPQDLGFPDQGLEGTLQAPRAYKLTSSSPVVAYQFNPLDNVDVFSNDASLLIPKSGFDTKYIAVSYATQTRRGPTVPGRDNYNGYVTVVATDDNTQIEVTPACDTLAGADGTPALAAHQPHAFTLNRFDVLNLEAVAGPDPFVNNGNNGGDLTGTTIRGTNNKTFGVFGGHEAVRIEGPASDCCMDHLEEMMFPTSTWGKQFAVGRTVPRRDVPDMLRIVALMPATQVVFSPAPMGTCQLFQPGDHCDVEFTQPTEITASQPVAVAHLMESAIQGMTGTGDPSMGMVPPVEQFRTDYKFLAPNAYDEQYVDIVAKQGDDVRLDNTLVAGFTPFGAGRMVATASLTVGAHTIACPLSCSIEVYGWSQAVSYLFAGGLDLKPIVIEHE